MSDETPTGRAKSAYARAKALSPQERSDIAKKAAEVRWSRPVLLATHGDPDHPLRIGDAEIPCYVLENGQRVLSQRGLQTGVGMSTGGTRKSGEQRLVGFLGSLERKGLQIRDLSARIQDPVLFFPPGGGRAAYGYEATILADLCDVILEARRAELLQAQQEHIALRCEILVRSFAKVGIIALVDEATGYQNERARDALAKILEAFIAKELQPWVRTFPTDYYAQLFRLRRLKYPGDSVQRPQYFGTLTNDIVYKRLAPGVLGELKRQVPRAESGRHKHRFHQKLTPEIGHPKLREHLASVVTVMKLSSDYTDFLNKLDRIHPRYNETFALELEYKAEEDTGAGL